MATTWMSADWWFRDRDTGKITIAQFPNPPLWVFLGAVAVGWFVDGTIGTAARVVATAALAWWAGDEVLRGVNPWRRALGVGGMAFVLSRLVDLA